MENEAPEVPIEGEEIFKKICKKLKFSYKPEFFANPHLQTFYSNLEALVFEETGIELIDTTLPNKDAQDSALHGYVDKLTEVFGKVFKFMDFFKLLSNNYRFNFFFHRKC